MGVDETAPPVVVDDPGSAGMPFITAQLMEDAVSRSPKLARRMRGSVVMWTTDYRAGVTVRFEGPRVSIVGERADDAWLVVEGEAITLARLGSGDHGFRALRDGTVRVPVRGLLRHPLFALRLRRLLSGG